MQDFSQPGIDRRVAPRAPIQVEVKIYYPDLAHLSDAISRDISVGGMFLESPTPPALGTEIRFDLHLPTPKPQIIHGEGVVVWSRQGESKKGLPGGCGIRFLRLDPRFRSLIFRVVDRFIQAGGEPFDLDLSPESAAEE